MTTVAIQSRNEAQFQQAEAEGLVAYMMDDLRTELKGVGRLDVMEGVNARALRYYSNQGELTGLSPDSLEQRAIVLHAMGEDAEDRGKLDEALSNFEQAFRTTQELLDREPTNPERIFAHSQSAYWVGYIAWEKLANDEALEHWQAYRDMAGKLRAVEPDEPRSFLELGYSEGNLCTFYLRDDRDPDRAEQHCLTAIEFLEQGLDVKPDHVDLGKTLANRVGWLARHYGKQERFDDALTLRKREATMMAELLERDPENNNLKMRLSWALAGEAEILSALRRHDEAVTTVAQARKLGSELLATEENSIQNLSSNVRTFVKAAETEKSGGSSQWRESARRSAELLEKIKRLDSAEYKELAKYRERLSAMNRESGQ